MMDIDWSKAPDGCTHFDPVDRNHLRQSVRSSEAWSSPNKCWEPAGWQYPKDLSTMPRLIKRPEWPTEGLPPVGTVCEFAMHDGGDWEEVQVIAHHNGYAVIAIASTDGFNVDVAECHELRPIRTAEQIATEERKLQREQLASMIAGYDGFDDPRERDLKLADYLLDHDYRKQEQK